MKHTIFLSTILMCIALVFVAPAFPMGQRPPAKKTEAAKALQISGKVTEINLRNSTVTVVPQTGSLVKLILNKKTVIAGSGRNAVISEIKKGNEIRASYQVKWGKKIASSIIILEEPKPKVPSKITPVKEKKSR